MLTQQNKRTNCFYSRYVVEITYLDIYFSGDAGAITLSLSEPDFYLTAVDPVVSSHPLPTLLEPEPLFFTDPIWIS
jgi:hypothetical protein